MKKILFLTCMVCLLNLAAFAQNKADFSGDWELDKGKGKLEKWLSDASVTMNVIQNDKAIQVETKTIRPEPIGEGVLRLTYSLDGKETVVEIGGGTEILTQSAVWENDNKLRLSSKREITANVMSKKDLSTTVTIKETWELADNGKTLNITRDRETKKGTKSSSTLVFRKKKAAVIETAAVSGETVSLPTPKVISGGVLNSKATNLVKPEFPEAARTAGVSGAVTVQVTIGESGDVLYAQAISGHPLLRGASEDAAKKSKFPPTLLQGVPVKVTGFIVYNFVAP